VVEIAIGVPGANVLPVPVAPGATGKLPGAPAAPPPPTVIVYGDAPQTETLFEFITPPAPPPPPLFSPPPPPPAATTILASLVPGCVVNVVDVV
jgi:hypothetical protein